MAVTIQAASLMQPVGELDCSFFPDNDLDAKIGGWLQKAKTKVQALTSLNAERHNDAAELWVYYLAYSYLAGRFAAMPNSVSVNNGADSVSYGQDRPAYWAGRASAARALFDEATVVVVTNSQNSMHVPVKVVW